jgi:threonine aldolase
MEAITNANNDFYVSYGDDEFTASANNIFRKQLGDKTYPFFVFNGTGANITALKALTNSYNAILCPDTAHINCDECAAPEKMTGCKLIPIPNTNGKISVTDVKKELKGFGFQHHAQIKVLAISQPTELGTIYTPKEIKVLADLMHDHNCYLFIDGSRISNASASLNLPIKSFTADLGVDAITFGGTKNGLLVGEAIVFFKEELAENFLYIRKQAAQLFSKNRFIAAQFIAYLSNDLNIKLANHSNNMAKYLETELKPITQIKISRPVETNAVFAYVPKELCFKLQEKHYFYIWDEETTEVRWMCSFNTRKEDIDVFINDIKTLV